MPRRKPIELSISHERWLVSYADFITLLFAFFVVMYSISQVNESKYKVLSNTLLGTFNVAPQSIKPIQVGEPSISSNPSVVANNETSAGDMPGDGAFEKTADLPQLSDHFTEQFSDLIDSDLVQVNSNEFWLQLELKSSILFATAGAKPTDEARDIFEEIGALLKGYSNPVQVEGFTDNQPINIPLYPSNWELSAARASAVVQLLAGAGVAPERLSAVGYGEFQPISDNATEAGRRQNRRVTLMIAREKIDRPKVSTPEQVEHAIAAPESTISSGEAHDLGSLLTPEPGQAMSSEEQALDRMLQPATTASPTQELQPSQQESDAEGGVKAIELENGGLLFTSDPDLPRNRK